MSRTSYLPVLERERHLTPSSVPLALPAASVILEWLPAALRRILRRRSERTLARATLGSILAGLLVLTPVRSEPDPPVLFDHRCTGHRFSCDFDFKEGDDACRGGDDRLETRSPGSFGDSRLGYPSWFPNSSRIPKAPVVPDDDALREVQKAAPHTGTYVAGEIPGYAYGSPAPWHLLAGYGAFRIYRTDRAGDAGG